MKYISAFVAAALLFTSTASALDLHVVSDNLGKSHLVVFPIYFGNLIADSLLTFAFVYLLAHLVPYIRETKNFKVIDLAEPLATVFHLAAGLLFLNVIVHILGFVHVHIHGDKHAHGKKGKEGHHA